MALFIQLFIWLELVWISRASFITTYSHSRRITYWKHIFYPIDILLHASFFFQALLTPKWFFILLFFCLNFIHNCPDNLNIFHQILCYNFYTLSFGKLLLNLLFKKFCPTFLTSFYYSTLFYSLT